jgi:hypothetical protein
MAVEQEETGKIGPESADRAQMVRAQDFGTWMVKVMVSLSPGPVSTIEPWYVPAGGVAGPLLCPTHDVIIGRPQSRIISNRIPRFDLPFFRRATNTQPGSHSTAPKATPPDDSAQGRDFRSSKALWTAWMVSVVLAVLLDAKFRLLGLKLHVMYCVRLAGRLHSSAMVPVKSVAVHEICAVPESPDRLMVGMVQLTLGGGSAIPESCSCCGVPLALSATFNVAVSDPAERLGVNFTLITQLPPAATLVPHGLVCEKSVAFAPEILMPFR